MRLGVKTGLAKNRHELSRVITNHRFSDTHWLVQAFAFHAHPPSDLHAVGLNRLYIKQMKVRPQTAVHANRRCEADLVQTIIETHHGVFKADGTGQKPR